MPVYKLVQITKTKRTFSMRTRPRMGLDIGYTYHCVGYVNHQVVYDYETSMAKFEYTFNTVEDTFDRIKCSIGLSLKSFVEIFLHQTFQLHA